YSYIPSSRMHRPLPQADHFPYTTLFRSFIAASTASGGGAAAVKNSTTCGSGFFSALGALSKVAITIGAPHRCVTLWLAMASYIAGARTQRRHTWVPATTEIDHGKHQPLQCNIGNVHR